jgi:hypothetical protein
MNCIGLKFCNARFGYPMPGCDFVGAQADPKVIENFISI